MWSIKLSVIACVLSLASSQDILFRSSLPGRVSHHTKTVTDGVSTVHRHHTQATNPSTRVQLVQSPVVETVLRQQEPVLLQHADGRFFALNANLQPGQFFQTSDGRIFTLRASSTQANRNRISGSVIKTTRDRAVETTTTEAPETTTEAVTTTTTSATTTAPEPVTEMPVLEDSDEASGRRTNEDNSNIQVAANIIATAPLTPSTARFVGASTPQHFNTFHSIDNNLVHAAFPVARGNMQLHQHVAPVFRSTVPVLRFQNAGHTQEEIRVDDQGNHALVRTHDHTAPSSTVVLTSNPTATFLRRRNPFASSFALSSPTFSSSSPAFSRFEAVPASETSQIVAAPVTSVAAAPLVQVATDSPAAIAARVAPQAAFTPRVAPQAAIASRGHQLADSSTSVFQGFYSFPSVGIDFDF